MRDHSTPNLDLVRRYGPEYGAAYRDAFARMPEGHTETEQQCRAEVAHWYALVETGNFRRTIQSAGLVGLADDYAVHLHAWGAAAAGEARRYADRVAAFYAEARRLATEIAART